jgi:hypothetical protein
MSFIEREAARRRAASVASALVARVIDRVADDGFEQTKPRRGGAQPPIGILAG